MPSPIMVLVAALNRCGVEGAVSFFASTVQPLMASTFFSSALSVLAVPGGEFAALWCAGWRLFRMQIRRTALRDVFREPGIKISSPRQFPRDDVAERGFGFHNRDVRLTGHRGT